MRPVGSALLRETQDLMRPATTIVLAVLLVALFGAAIFQFLSGDLTGGGSTGSTVPTTRSVSTVAVTEAG